MIVAVLLYEREKAQTDEHFLVANRTVSGTVGAMSIAASWIWAPALFVSTQVGYQWGYSGLFWFTVPNIFALILFAPFAAKVRERIPLGFSYIQYIGKYGAFYKNTQLLVQLGVQLIAFGIQVTAGAELISLITGASYSWIVIVMTIAPLLYSLISGLSSSVFTDAIQYALIFFSVVVIFVGFPAFSDVSRSALTSFHPLESDLLLHFGLASALALIFGIFADHQQWQRAFAIEEKKVARTYIGAGLLHGVITFSLGTLGVLISSIEFKTTNVQLVAADYISQTMPSVFTVIFTFMALCGLCSTLDSCFCAFGSLVSTELSTAKVRTPVARRAMVLLAVLGLIIGLSRVSFITLWFFAGVFRLISFPPIYWSIFGKNFSGRIAATAMLLGLLFGAPVFIYGSIYSIHSLKILGMILCLGLTTLICILGRAYSAMCIPANHPAHYPIGK